MAYPLFIYTLCRALMKCRRGRLEFRAPIPSAHARHAGAEAHHFDDLGFLASSFLLGHNVLSKDDSSKKSTHTHTSQRPDFNHGGFIHSPTSMLLERRHVRLCFCFLCSHGHAHRRLSNVSFSGRIYNLFFFSHTDRVLLFARV